MKTDKWHKILAVAALLVLLAPTAGSAGVFSAARAGDAKAQIKLGLAYLSGSGVPRDYVTAMKWFRRAAKQGDPQAMYYIGGMYEDGRGVPRNYPTAFKWYLAAAKQGHADSQWEVGRFYYEGFGVSINYVKAFAWWKLAAAQGQAEAIYAIIHQRPSYESDGAGKP